MMQGLREKVACRMPVNDSRRETATKTNGFITKPNHHLTDNPTASRQNKQRPPRLEA
jgi:hypothetical protein